MVLRYVTGNLVQFTITYYVTTTIRPTTNRTWLTDRENPTMITNVDTNVFVNVAIMFSFELRMDDKESRSKSRTSPRLYVTFIYISSSTFQTVTRGDPLSAKQEFVSSSFSLSTEALRVASAFLCDQACGQAFTAFPSTPSIIFWSRICSILRAKRRSMFRTDFPYVTGNLGQFTIIRGNQGRGEQGRGNGSVKMHGRAVPGFLVR